jgi:hypothetical protein
VLVDPAAGVGAQLGGGVFTHFAFVTLSGTVGAAQSGILSVGCRLPNLVGPVGLYASLDGVTFFHPQVLLGAGATLGVSTGLSRWVDLLVEAQGRHLQPSTEFHSNYLLVDVGLRVHLAAPADR